MKLLARNLVIFVEIVSNLAAFCGADVSRNLVIALCGAGIVLST